MNIRLTGQAVMQLCGLMYAVIRYSDKEIDLERYAPELGYSLPFAGEWQTANGGVTKELSHSWEILPQRYAYDFYITDENGCSFSGERTNLNSYYCYGKDVLAPADGIVVAVKNHFPDCRIMADGQTDPDTPDIGGNRIIIRHSHGAYSAACHLMPESAAVQKGQAVKRGEVIGRCGNSGNTTEPHIHFQIQNRAGFYSCLGLPARFDQILVRDEAGYSRIDAALRPAKEEIRAGYIHRGLLVRNQPGPEDDNGR